MAGDDEDLELLLSMQDDENAVVNATPPSSPARHDPNSVRAEVAGGFYSKIATTSGSEAENSSFSSRMAEIRSAFAAKSNGAPARHSVVTAHSPLLSTGPIRTLDYCSDDETPKTKHAVSMDAFKDILKGSLELEGNKLPSATPKQTSHQGLSISSIDIEFFSGLKIKDRLVPPAEVYNKLEDLRFVRLPAIKMANECGKFSGSWATIAILVDKGPPRQSSTGKNFVIWKLGTLDSNVISLFLFGDAYKAHWKEQPGSILAVLNANVRTDPKTKEPSLSVFNCDQVLMLGTSVNFAICSGIRKDGTRCTVGIDKRLHGQYCQYHIGAQQHKYKTKRPELSGGKMAMIGPGFERGHMKRKPLDSPEKENTPSRPLKLVTTSQLKLMLSDERITTKSFSQGKRFLENMADRVVGKRKSTEVEEKLKISRVPLAEKGRNLGGIKAEFTNSARTEKRKDMDVTGIKTDRVTLASGGKSQTLKTGQVRRKEISKGKSMTDDMEMEIEWSGGSEDEMIHALSRFGKVHALVS
ncbi:minichromosome maintenance protein 10 [Marchantia polymorpha subsp. ruderalis]|uniref:Zinc finger Mcm10/DnaG-type domain-containing protein n=2 Tax=Marchantia polymorpha TaxID=3197 RepID=A0AAF6BXF0_MARPO|nr:hypothetical protein MARPO_0068s0001 [Marchantia polymorpha]BBN16684.1 hypothetical protein Mp_7g08470 [Marchantia polymorpha subsp. ruderalis]|eukprot:PTQ35767.1 hypothetical protein MARPO_0068s0001 [Marchantia polymorpha]